MRVFCYGSVGLSRRVVLERLDRLHEKTPLVLVVGWGRNRASMLGVEWATAHGIQGMVASNPRLTSSSIEFQNKAELSSLFYTYRPNLVLIMGTATSRQAVATEGRVLNLASEVGATVEKIATVRSSGGPPKWRRKPKAVTA